MTCAGAFCPDTNALKSIMLLPVGLGSAMLIEHGPEP
jgi:hypothetical protein